HEAVRDEPAGDLEAPQGAGARGSGVAEPRCATAPGPPRSGAAGRRDRLAAVVSTVLGGALLEARHAARRAQGRWRAAQTSAQRISIMTMSSTLHITTPSDREIAMTRVFDAPRARVFDTFTKPELVRRWLTGPDGWAFAVCDIDLRAGGKYRYVWRKAGVPDMGMGGEFREVVPPERYVATEQF